MNLRFIALSATALTLFACGRGEPAVELSSPSTGEIVTASQGQLLVAVEVTDFTAASAAGCEQIETPCGRIQLIIDGQSCGSVEQAAAVDSVVIHSTCNLTSGKHTVRCELFDHRDNAVVAKSEEVTIDVVRADEGAKSGKQSRCDDDHDDDDDDD